MAKRFYDDESGSNGYWDLAYLLAGEINDSLIRHDDLQETIYNLIKYDYNDELKRVLDLEVNKDGCIRERER